MIIRFFIILIIFQVSLTESCVRTIPPEDVYITSTPDNLPITEEPVITDAPVTDAPVTDAPVTDAPVTITDAPVDPENLCMECDLKAVSPIPTDPAVTFTSKILSSGGECLVSEMICERTDDKTCDSAEFVATTSTGAVSVTNSFTATKTTTIIECQKDGTFSAGAANGITKLECNFINCVDPPNPCAQCDVKTIAPTLTDPGVSFTTRKLDAPGQCLVSEMTCKRTDDTICSLAGIVAVTPGGNKLITDSFTSTSATTVVTCEKDGTYSWDGTVTGITKLECAFADCGSPCKTCNPESFEPDVTTMPAGVVYEFIPTNAPGTCLTGNARCYKLDEVACEYFGIGTLEFGLLETIPSAFLVSMPVSCGNDGKWKTGSLAVDRIYCFSDC
ncbi:unnamed protein product [Caenorhabditis nigoni]